MADSTITIGILTMGDPSGAAAVTSALAGVTSTSSSASAETIKLSAGMKTTAAEARAAAAAEKEAAKAKEAVASAAAKDAAEEKRLSDGYAWLANQVAKATAAQNALNVARQQSIAFAQNAAQAQAAAFGAGTVVPGLAPGGSGIPTAATAGVVANTTATAINTATVTANTQARTAAVTTTQRLTQAQQQNQVATSNAAMGFLFLSQAIEDAQYGFGAILNNIPLIIMSMGRAMGLTAGAAAGLAGGISILAVGLNILFKNVDFVGKSLGEFAAKLRDTADASDDHADSLMRAAHSANEADRASDRLKRTTGDLIEKYAKEKEAIEAVTAARIADIEAAESLGDAESKLEMAKLKQSHEAGGISDVDFEVEKAGIRKRAEQRKFDSEQAKRDALKEKQDAEADRSEREAMEASQRAAEFEKASKGMLTDKERDAQKAKRTAAIDKRNQAAAAESAGKEEPSHLLEDIELGNARLWGVFAPELQKDAEKVWKYNRKVEADYQKGQLEQAAKLKAESEKELKESQAALDADKTARETTGIGDRAAAEGAAKKLREERAAAIDRAAKAREAAAAIDKKSASEKSLFGVTQEIADVEGSTDVDVATQRTRKKEEAQQKKEAKERERASKGIRDLAGDAATAGMSDTGVADLRKAAEKIQQDKPTQDAEVLALLKAMTMHLVQGNTKDEAMRKEIDNLTEQIKNMRDGN